MEYQEVKIEGKTKPTTSIKGLKINGAWMSVEGNAEKYFDSVNWNDTCKVGIENGKVVFIGKAGNAVQGQAQSQPASRSDDIQERIMKTACFNMASRIVAQKQISSGQPYIEAINAQAVRAHAVAIYKELKGFLASEQTESGIEIPVEDMR